MSTSSRKSAAEQWACDLGEYLRKRRLAAEGRPTQQEVAAKLDVAPSWISRMEKGEFSIRSPEDLETYARALGDDPDEYLRTWVDWQAESMMDRLPWPERIVFAETFRRQGEERAQLKQAAEELDRLEVVPGVKLGVLVEAIRRDRTCREVVLTFCRMYDPDYQEGY